MGVLKVIAIQKKDKTMRPFICRYLDYMGFFCISLFLFLDRAFPLFCFRTSPSIPRPRFGKEIGYKFTVGLMGVMTDFARELAALLVPRGPSGPRPHRNYHGGGGTILAAAPPPRANGFMDDSSTRGRVVCVLAIAVVAIGSFLVIVRSLSLGDRAP